MMRRMRPSAFALAILASFALAAHCGSMEKAAAKDPLKCERDPQCQSRGDKSKDCATQCADSADCMKRCEAIQQGTDRMP